MTKIFEKPIEYPLTGTYSLVKEFAVAEVNFTWMQDAQAAYPEEWEILHKDPNSAAYAAIHLWMRKYMPEMYDWLKDRGVDWIGFTESILEDNEMIEYLYIRMHREEDVTAFRLTWC